VKRLVPFLGASWLFVLLGACTVERSSAPAASPEAASPESDDASAPSAANSSVASEDAELEARDLPEPAADQGTKPAARPEPTPGGNVRTCGTPLTAAKPLRRSRVSTKTKPIKLGAAIIDGKVSSTTLWAAGTPQPPSFSGLQGVASVGPDLDDVAFFLGWDDSDANDLFATHVGGKNALQIWANAVTPTARRMTFTSASSAKQGAYSLSPENRTAGAPLDPGDEQYVRFASAAKSVGVSLVMTTASDCATGALADLLGTQPIVRNGLHVTVGTLLDPAKRAQIQDLLVRDGTEIMLAVITTRSDAAIDKLVQETTCSPTDLAACEQVLEDLEKATSAFMAADGTPTYQSLSTATDPNWAFLRFTPGDLRILP